MRRPLFIAFLLIFQAIVFPLDSFAQTATGRQPEAESTAKNGSGKPVPEKIMKALLRANGGESFTLESLKGMILINLCAAWSKPCRLTMPILNTLQDKYRDRGLTVIGLDVDSENRKETDAFRKDRGLDYLVVSDSELANQFIAVSGFSAIPQSFLIADGKVIAIYRGYNPEKTPAEMEKNIEEYLKGK